MQPPRPADLEGRLIANSVHARLFGGDERPTRLGSYVIVRRIGGGAMGDVFLGYHDSLDRKAAIKLVRPAAEDSTIERQRLLREARVLARIDHPNVIRVHDSGTHDNRVYLAMEYVQGTTLGVWQKGRPWRAILGAYLQAGHGLDAVHRVVLDDDRPPGSDSNITPRRGLCHRDFKPDNVLIGEAGDVRVADFGLAVPAQRQTADPNGTLRPLDLRLTADASVVGTPLYISPEQLNGSPGDARSDQYSFCVALYEALYDQHPFYAPAPPVRNSDFPTDSGGPGRTAPQFALFEAILSAPLRPAPRSKVPRRIHAILARGLQRDPAARYPSMAELLAALARDPKRRILQGLAATLAVGTAFGIGLYANSLPAMCSNIEQETADLWNDARKTEVQQAFTATGASHAQSSFAAVDTAVRNYLERWTTARQAACDASYLSGSQTHDAHQRSMSCLDRQLALFSDVIGDLENVDGGTIAGARDRLEILPDPDDCDARSIHARSCDYEPASDMTVARVRSQIREAQAAEIAGRMREAVRLAEIAAPAARAAGTPTLVIDAHFTLGRVLAELGRPAPALDAFRTALAAAEAASCDPATIDLAAAMSKLVALNPEIDVEVGRLLNDLGLAKLHRSDERDSGREAQLLSDRGLLHEYRDENYAAAEHDYRAALQLRHDSGLADTTAQARTQQNLGNVLGKPDVTAQTVAERQAAVTSYQRSYGEEHPQQWKPLFNLGLAQYDLGQLAEADATLTRSLAFATAMLGEDSPDVRDIHSALANIAIDRSDGASAQRRAEAGLSTCEGDSPTLPLECFGLRRQLAYGRYLQGDHPEALRMRTQILADLRTRSNEDELVEQHIDLAASFVALKRWAEALAQTKIAETTLQRGTSDRHVPELLLYKGEALLGLNRPNEAIAAFERAQDLADADPGVRATSEWGLARGWCAMGHEAGLAKGFARTALAYFETDRIDPETAGIVADIDKLLRSECLPKPQQ